MPLLDLPIEQLANEAPPNLAISDGELDRIADLAYELARKAQAGAGIIHGMPPYRERTPSSRKTIRDGVKRVVQAMVLLGWIERPD
jgi:hypothetical protein